MTSAEVSNRPENCLDLKIDTSNSNTTPNNTTTSNNYGHITTNTNINKLKHNNHNKLRHDVDKNDTNDNLKDGVPTINNHPYKVPQKDLDFINANDLFVASMKPSPSSSISQTLLSKINLLSSPFARKLKFWNKKSFQVNHYDPSFKVIYLGNLGMQLWNKDDSCLEKPLSTLWNNYLVNMKTEIVMRLTICNSGLKAITRQHGLTQYWSNRLVYCCSHENYPRIFSWIYRHEGKKMRQELRLHAVFCPTPEKPAKMVTLLNQRLASALQEFKREKKTRGISISVGGNPSSALQQNLPRTIPLRRQILEKGSANFRPPLERSKSAPKLTSIQEECDFEEDEEVHEEIYEDDDEDDDADGDIYGVDHHTHDSVQDDGYDFHHQFDEHLDHHQVSTRENRIDNGIQERRVIDEATHDIISSWSNLVIK